MSWPTPLGLFRVSGDRALQLGNGGAQLFHLSNHRFHLASIDSMLELKLQHLVHEDGVTLEPLVEDVLRPH